MEVCKCARTCVKFQSSENRHLFVVLFLKCDEDTVCVCVWWGGAAEQEDARRYCEIVQHAGSCCWRVREKMIKSDSFSFGM